MRKQIFNAAGMLQLVSVLILLSSCGGKKTASDETEEQLPLVKTTIAIAQMVEQQVTLTGNIEPFEKAYISPAAPMRVERIFKEVGDFVRKGDLLVQMDISNYRQAKIQLDNLEMEFARLDTLFKVGSISQQQLDQMATQLEVARTSYRNLTENTQLRSPINGVISGRFYENGEMFSMSPVVDGRAALFTVETINPVKVTVSVPEQFFPKVDKDMNVVLSLDVYPGQQFNGSVFLKYPTIDPTTRTFTVELQFPNQNLLIRPGMFGRVVLGFGEANRVVVSDMAVLRQPGTNERFVFVEKDGRVERRTVILGRLVDSQLEIISGIEPGEAVVVTGHNRLLDGSAVNVVND